MKYFFICLFLCIPVYSNAAVVINEIAWMGDSDSANNEWIELYNNGNDLIDVEGWILSDGMNLDIELTGAVGPGQFAVLERTDDESALGTAFLIYTGGLVNSGATLSLYRADNSLADRIVGGEAWVNIGGDNTTKETAQYTTGGWITAKGTPGVINTSFVPEPNTEDETEATQTKTKTTKKSLPKKSIKDEPHVLSTDIEIPSRVYVNQEVTMKVNSQGLADAILNSLEHRWNFGDLNTKKGKEITHRFQYAGEYVVTLYSQYKEYQAFVRKTIVVLPVSFSLTTNSLGDIQVNNDARYEVDVSGYTIVGKQTVTFPEGTVILPNATITIQKEKLKNTNNVILFDDIGVPVAVLQKSLEVQSQVVPPKTLAVATAPVLKLPIPTPEALQKQIEITKAFTFENTAQVSSKSEITPTTTVVKTTTTTPSKVTTTENASKTIPKGKLPYYALLGVIALGVTTVFVTQAKKQ